MSIGVKLIRDGCLMIHCIVTFTGLRIPKLSTVFASFSPKGIHPVPCLTELGHLIFSCPLIYIMGFPCSQALGLRLNYRTGFPGLQTAKSRAWNFSASITV